MVSVSLQFVFKGHNLEKIEMKIFFFEGKWASISAFPVLSVCAIKRARCSFTRVISRRNT